MPTLHKIIALDLKNSTFENFEHWCLTTDFISANSTKDYIKYRILEQTEENPMRFIFIIDDFFFGTVQENDYRTIHIPDYIQTEFVEHCIPIKLHEIEPYRSVIIDWIFNNNRTKAKIGFELLSFQKFNDDDDEEMMFPNFTNHIICIDVLDLGFTLLDFFSPFNDKFKAILQEFKMHYEGGGYLNRVKLSRMYIVEKYIMGFSFKMDGQPLHHFHYNMNFEDMLFDYIKPFTFDQDIELTLDNVLDKINLVGMEQISELERKILTKNL
jgi:hypothetical protein